MTPEERLTKRRKAALAKLGGDEKTGGASGFVYASTAAKLLGVSLETLRAVVEPHHTAPNPHHRSGPQASLYDPIDLLRVSKQQRVVKARMRSTPARKEAAQKAAATRRAKALQEAEDAVLKWQAWMPNCSWAELNRAAVESYEAVAANHNRAPNYDRINGDRRTLILNYLRHECSDYEFVLAMVAAVLRGRVARDPLFGDPVSEARELIHKRIADMAVDRWPEMADLA